MARFTSRLLRGAVPLAFVLAALAQSWPLPLRMATHLTGAPETDAGVYVWNLWVFSHELFAQGTLPLRTLEVLPLDGPTDLSLHNYTIFSDLLAVPLLGLLGVVRTFNVVYLINCALLGWGMYLLARRLTGRVMESCLAGLMMAWAPFVITRGTEHFSLAAAAPLPFFMLALYRAWDSQRLRDAVLAGAAMAWAAFCDPYYAVYCLMLGLVFVGTRVWDISVVRRPAKELWALKHLLHVGIAIVAALILVVHVFGGGAIRLGAFRASMRTLYTPMLVLTVLALARLALSRGLRVRANPAPARPFALRATVTACVIAALLMAPTLSAVSKRVLGERPAADPVLWRSSAPGIDLLSFLIPNPNHALAPQAWHDWLDGRPGGYIDQVASLSWVGLIVIVAAWRLASYRPGRLWIWITGVFALLSMGPFLQLAGFNTQIPGPWALLRYAPVIGDARMPGRMAVVVMMGFCVIFAEALAALGRRYPDRRRLLVSTVGLVLAAELLPAPRPLYSAALPRVYETVAADPRPVRVLKLPTGVRDGLSALGNFNPATQFYQTLHGKGLIGGYLSRVTASCKDYYRGEPVMGALLALSEGRTLDRSRLARAIIGVDDFLARTNLGYVVMNRARVTPELREFAVVLLRLTKLAELDGYELYAPALPPSAAGGPR